MSAYDKLSRPLQKWIRDQGWTELRDIQSRTIHAVMDNSKDIIIAAETAGGKTEAAFLPLISQIIEADNNGSSGFDLVYIGPLKALINDQHRRLEDICYNTDISITPWHGDISSSIKSKARKNPQGVLLITPESLEALFVRHGSLMPHLFGKTSAVVIDELHTFLDAERGVQLRSLLTRLELATSCSIRRIGLSATLGDMALTKRYLRPKSVEDVVLIEAEGGQSELRLQLRGYVAGNGAVETAAAIEEVAYHLFKNLRGSNNLIFAGARQRVEIYADRLRRLCEASKLPQEFFPHHASLSREHREFVEKRLKDDTLPTTAICTSTLELGIDIGDVTCVAQIGAPFTVASLRQRLGRSGRREGQAAILRQYDIEDRLDAESHIADQLRLGLIRTIAMIELLLGNWCEPPKPQALHLSTLVHQILSVIAERGGASAQRIYVTLCEKGPFLEVDKTTFLEVLRQIGSSNVSLIEQREDGLLLLGREGERVVEHYSFFAVFKTPEEYRIVSNGKQLGTIPLDNILMPGMTLIFSGRRWEVIQLDDRDKVILVKPARAGVPPRFGGDPGNIHDRVIEKMREVLLDDQVPKYLDDTATTLLIEARSNFRHSGLRDSYFLKTSENRYLIAPWCGSVKLSTLALALRSFGYKTIAHDGLLEVDSTDTDIELESALNKIGLGESINLFDAKANLMIEKFHVYLNEELLMKDALSSRLDEKSLPAISESVLAGVRNQVF